MNVLFKFAGYTKIYDSHKEDDIYDALYAISIGLSNRYEIQKKLKVFEEQIVKLIHTLEHIRIYMNLADGYKIVHVRRHNKVVMTKYFMLNIYCDRVTIVTE